MLPVIRGTGRDLARDRNIHPHGRNGWRTQLPGFFLTGGPCGSPSFFLPFMLSIFFDPTSLSDFRFLRLPRARSRARSLSLSLCSSFLLLRSRSLSLSGQPGFVCFISLVQPRYVRLSFFVGSFSLSLRTFYTGYTGARPFCLPPSPSFSRSLFLFPSHLRAIRSDEAPDESRENTAYRSYSAQSF